MITKIRIEAQGQTIDDVIASLDEAERILTSNGMFGNHNFRIVDHELFERKEGFVANAVDAAHGRRTVSYVRRG